MLRAPEQRSVVSKGKQVTVSYCSGQKARVLAAASYSVPPMIHILSLNFDFFICKRGVMIIPASQNKAWPKGGINEWDLLYYIVVVHTLLILKTSPVWLTAQVTSSHYR